MKKYFLHRITESMRFTTEVSFDPMEETFGVQLEDSDTMIIMEPEQSDIEHELSRIRKGRIEFFIITLPRVVHQVRYIQVCKEGKEYLMQGAVEKDHRYHLVEKKMRYRDVLTEAAAFCETGEISTLSSFEKVEFYRDPFEILRAASGSRV